MKSSDLRRWFQRALVHVEGSLLQKSAAESPSRITKEFVRTALTDGLKAAKPNRSSDVSSEVDTPWNSNDDINVPSRPFDKGRAKQHDVAIRDGLRIIAAAEVKWLVKNSADKIVQDVWKLVMSHSTSAIASDSCRTYLLVGGEKNAFQNTLNSVRLKTNLHFSWSPQGRAGTWPRPFQICTGSLANNAAGQDALIQSISRRPNAASPYHRVPPDLWWNYRARVVARGWRTIRGSTWKLALWEIDYKKSVCGTDTVDFSALGPILP
jgi:hypothetical protein